MRMTSSYTLALGSDGARRSKSDNGYHIVQRLRSRKLQYVEEKIVDGTGDVTNQSEDSSVETTLMDGYPIEYSCTRYVRATFPQGIAVNSLVLNFDYEYAVDTRDVDATSLAGIANETAPGLEWGILWKTSDILGLRTCAWQGQGVDSWWANTSAQAGNRRLVDTESLVETESNYVVGLSSLERDKVDTSVENCQYLVDIPKSYACIPMKGLMNAEYIGDDEQAVREYILYHISQVVDDQEVWVGKVRKTLYIGDRQSYSASFEGDDRSTVALSASVSVVAVLAFFAIAGFASRRRRRPNVDGASLHKAPMAEGQDLPSQTPVDSDVTESTWLTSRSPSVPKLASSPVAETSAETTETADGYSMVTAENSSIDPVDADKGTPVNEGHEIPDTKPTESCTPNNCETHLNTSLSSDELSDVAVQGDDSLPDQQAPAEATTDNVETVEVDQTNAVALGSNLHIVEFLPPLPPHGPSKPLPPSQTSKTIKRRRRRKKKKKQVLKRVNSRESITEMETIAEAHEEEDGHDEGSEYSWSTSEDGSSRGAGSRDPSPARSIQSNESGGAETQTRADDKRIRALPPPWV